MLANSSAFSSPFRPSFLESFMHAPPVVAIFCAVRALRGTCAFSPRLPRCPELARFPRRIRLQPARAARQRAVAAAIPQTLCEALRAFAAARLNRACAPRQGGPVIRRTAASCVNSPGPGSSRCAAATRQNSLQDQIPHVLCARAKKLPRLNPPLSSDRARCTSPIGTLPAGIAEKAIQRRPDPPPRIAAAIPCLSALLSVLTVSHHQTLHLFV